ncbi:hypothetical protein EVG20_g9041 [Dentipellis fragilis]|uniref:Uncharacterized protein n=1 Tax=Dentipellis fragilis TaxID=205917 RepID=A0A4Y9Y5P9_9AGAM|nr:hypothetical protein EVG20_g9041 [Dentipellis fragilis]
MSFMVLCMRFFTVGRDHLHLLLAGPVHLRLILGSVDERPARNSRPNTIFEPPTWINTSEVPGMFYSVALPRERSLVLEPAYDSRTAIHSHNYRAISTDYSDTVYAWVAHGTLLQGPLEQHIPDAVALAIFSDGMPAAHRSNATMVHICMAYLNTMPPIKPLSPDNCARSEVGTLPFFSDAVSAVDEMILAWDADSGEFVHSHPEPITSIAVLVDRQRIVSGDIHIWGVGTRGITRSPIGRPCRHQYINGSFEGRRSPRLVEESSLWVLWLPRALGALGWLLVRRCAYRIGL